MEIATAKRKFAFISKTFSEIMCTYKKTSDFFNLGKRRPVVLPEYTNIELCRAKTEQKSHKLWVYDQMYSIDKYS